jgi:predicted Kef-type K+ transport protein
VEVAADTLELVWISAAFGLGLIFSRVGLPPLVGFLLAGFALNALGLRGGPTLEHIAHLGVLLLLFSVGLKLRIRNVVRLEVSAGSLVHLVFMLAVFYPLLRFGLGANPPAALLLAAALGFSSTVVAAKILEEKRELRSFHGRVVIGILVVQDLVAVALLAIASGGTPSPWAALLLALPLVRPLIFRFFESSGHDELLLLFGLLLALVGGYGFGVVGLSSELGALLLGVLVAGHPRAVELSDRLWALKELFLVAFFLQIGMTGAPDLNALMLGALFALLLPVKALLFFFVLLRFGLRARTSFLAAVHLMSYSEFALIVAGVAVKTGWLAPEWLVTLAVTVALSFAVSAPLARSAHRLQARFEQALLRFEPDRHHPDEQPLSLGAANVLIVGMGRVGTGAYDFLKRRRTKLVGLDSDPGKVEKHRAAGRRVLFGDGEDPALWHQLPLHNIRAIMLAMPDLEAKLLSVKRLRDLGFRGLIAATGVYPEEEEAMRAAGADLTFNYYDEAGVGFAEHTWEALQAQRAAAALFTIAGAGESMPAQGPTASPSPPAAE